MASPDIVLYHYAYSPYARRVLWYLALRNIKYAQCVQPPILPRPDLAALGVSYRRIPVLALGRDVYCDTRLQLQVLDAHIPPSSANPSIAVHGPEAEAISALFSKWFVGGLFPRASELIPQNLPLLKDPKFIKDREDLSGRSWKQDYAIAARPEAMVQVREGVEILEKLLGDGRDWICKTATPSIADIEAVWIPHWLISMKGALDETAISAKLYPKVYAWVDRFDGTVKQKMKAAGKPETLDGKTAAKGLLQADFIHEPQFDDLDPLKLKQGETVEVWPTDSGMSRRDKGKLVGLNKQEIVIETLAGDGSTTVHMHFPRSLFRVKSKDSSRL